MSEVFADTGYWVALEDPRDQLHGKALALTRALGLRRIVTTQMVLVEMLNIFGSRGERQRYLASGIVERAERSVNVDVIPQTDEQFRAAVERYAHRPDQAWSLTDCASFLVMEERGITEALAHDRDFEQAGFVALLR